MQDFLNNLNKLWNIDELLAAPQQWQQVGAWGISLGVTVAVAVALGWIVRIIIGGLIGRLTGKTKTLWDDYLFDKRFFSHLGRFLPAVAGYFLFQAIFATGEEKSLAEALFKLGSRLMLLWICWSGFSFLSTLVDNVERGFLEINGDKRVPVRSYVQVAKLLLGLVACILVVAVLLDQNPLGILTGLGALTAVLLLVFKDALLGLTASLQLNSNNIVQVGDWIEFPGSNVEGEVIEIALSVVKVKAGDNTVFSLPTYNLVSVPFKNWRNVKDSGARRIKLALALDALSLAPVEPAREAELRRTGRWRVPAELGPATNLEAFRHWAQDYLAEQGAAYAGQPCLAKIGDPAGRGVPVEMVFYSTVTAYPDWELLRSRLYCHFLAALPDFGLRLFQEPVGVQALR